MVALLDTGIVLAGRRGAQAARKRLCGEWCTATGWEGMVGMVLPGGRDGGREGGGWQTLSVETRVRVDAGTWHPGPNGWL